MGFLLVILACVGPCSPSTAMMFKSRNLFLTESECSAKGEALTVDMKNKAPIATIIFRCVAKDNGGT